MNQTRHNVTMFLKQWQEGDRDALDHLIPVVYTELKNIARKYLYKERKDHTLSTAGLINEVFMKLIDQKNIDWKNRAQFFGVTAQIMRRVLLD